MQHARGTVINLGYNPGAIYRTAIIKTHNQSFLTQIDKLTNTVRPTA